MINLHADQYIPKSRNCFMERGEGENLEKCSICLGTLAKAAFFIMNLTNFIIADEGSLLLCVQNLRLTKPASREINTREARLGKYSASANRRTGFLFTFQTGQ